jgi:hypothetical protein
VVHVANRDYRENGDLVTPTSDIRAALRNEVLGYEVADVRCYTPDGSTTALKWTPIADGIEISVPSPSCWNVVRISRTDRRAARPQ